MNTAIILLGKSGDILNCLPIAHHIFKTTGEKPFWIVEPRYFPTLLGASYVEPDIIHFAPHRLDTAKLYAKSNYTTVLCPQVWGMYAVRTGRETASYNRAAWIAAGYGGNFDNRKDYPLVIDRRDADRERFLCNRHIKNNKPIMLLSLSCAKSSPFQLHSQFEQAIRRKWENVFQIIDLCKVKAGRIYDMLGLFDKAALLITGDTSALHLAAASTVPVLALVNDNPWLGTDPRCEVILKLKYGEAVKRVTEVHQAIAAELS